MSCIAGIVNFDKTPVIREDLENMARLMSGKAPDGSDVWLSGSIGLAFCLQTTNARRSERLQPQSLDGDVWIVADARIDAQRILREKLRAEGRHISIHTSDAELIIHTYLAYGSQFLDHLLGDFAFALWDEKNSLLICACDHFGIRPIYYTKTDRQFIFSSDLKGILACSKTKPILNEIAIGDFLMFGGFMAADMTIYEGIHRLSPATSLQIHKDGSLQSATYWTLPSPSPQPPTSILESVVTFRNIFVEAIKDRVQGDYVALEMSGGMDSTAIAALAASISHPATTSLSAYSVTCSPLLPIDREPEFATSTASFLHIPITFNNISHYPVFARTGSKDITTTQPIPSYNSAFSYDSFTAMINNGARILISGFMADSLFNIHHDHIFERLRKKQIRHLSKEILSQWKTHRTFRGLGLRQLLRGSSTPVAPWPLPPWIDPEFVARLNLTERWELHWQSYSGSRTADHLTRPWLNHHLGAYEVFDLPIVARFPFMDLRLINFMMTLPPHLKFNKYILRQAMRGLLPKEVLERPKEGVQGDILRAKIDAGLAPKPLSSTPVLVERGYINHESLDEAYRRFQAGEGKDSTFWSGFILQPIALEHWLSQNQLD